MTTMRRYAVVGGGFSGIAAAWCLASSGASVSIFERSSSLGGRSAPGMLGDREVTYGGKNIGKGYRRFRAFTAEFGDSSYEPFGINSSRIENGSLVTIDSTHRLRSVSQIMRAGTPRDIVRFARLAYLMSRSEDARFLGASAFTQLESRVRDGSLASWFSPRFCSAVIRPMTVRMNGAEAGEAFIGNFNTNLAMLLDSYEQLTAGLGPVLSRFQDSLECHLNTHVTGLLVEEGRVGGVKVADAAGKSVCRKFDGVVLAGTAAASSALLEGALPALAGDLSAVRYFPAAVILAEYSRPVFTPSVRAIVFGPTEVLSNAGTYGIDDLQTVRYTFSGQLARGMITEAGDGLELLASAEAALGRFMPVSAARRVRFGLRTWEHAYCAYGRDYTSLLREIRVKVSRVAGLGLTGDYLCGASIESCFRAAEDCAGALLGAIDPHRFAFDD